MKVISEMVNLVTRRYADKIAVICNREYLTYHYLGCMIDKFNRLLLEMGLDYQDRVAIFLPNSPLFIIAFFALAKIGAITVPLNIDYKEEELKNYLIAFRIKYIILNKQKEDNYKKVIKDMFVKPIIVSEENSTGKVSEGLHNKINIKVDPEDEVLYQFSSGSTGKPKIVARTHINLLNEAKSLSHSIGVSTRDKILCPVPLFHAYGLSAIMMVSIYSGATLVITDNLSPHNLLNILEKEKITLFFGVPYIFSMLLNITLRRKIKLPFLKYCFSAGISLPLFIAKKFYSQFGIFPRSFYGTTETGCISINLNKHVEDILDSVGPPIKGTEIRIILENGKPAKVGQIGEIVVKSLSCGRNYYINNKAKSLLIGGYFYTGDLGKKDEKGNLYIVGRKTFFINVAGVKVDPKEVERVLKKYPGVKEVVVLGFPDKLRGELVKAIIVSDGSRLNKKLLLKFCRERLAAFKVPSDIEFRDRLPMSPLGKILKA